MCPSAQNHTHNFHYPLPASDKLYSEVDNVQAFNQLHLQHKCTPLCKFGNCIAYWTFRQTTKQLYALVIERHSLLE
jgi:hypothetical protein